MNKVLNFSFERRPSSEQKPDPNKHLLEKIAYLERNIENPENPPSLKKILSSIKLEDLKAILMLTGDVPDEKTKKSIQGSIACFSTKEIIEQINRTARLTPYGELDLSRDEEFPTARPFARALVTLLLEEKLEPYFPKTEE